MFKRLLILSSFFIFFISELCGQNPGNIGTTNLTAWFKPDVLTAGNVTSWSTAFPTGASAITVTDASAPYPFLTNTPAGNVSNYNKTIEFSANTTAALKALQNTSSLNLLNNASSGNQGTFICAYYISSPSPNGHMVLYNETGTDGIQCRNLGANGRLAIGKGLSNSTNACRDWAENFIPTIISYKGNRSGAATMSTYENLLLFNTAVASQSSGATGLHFGVMPGNVNSAFNGYLHEVIFYNRDLTSLELSKAHTYLAIKYGITLDNSGGGAQGDYVATDGTIIWDASIRPGFHNNVIGIGRDDNEALLQKQSHAFDDTTRLYINTLASTNIANTGSFTTDVSYVIAGHSMREMCATANSNAEVPAGCGLYSRLEREWKVTRSNMNQPFNMDFKLNVCAVPGSVNIADLRFLVDDDSDFSNGGTACYYNGDGTGIVISYAYPVITVSNIQGLHIPDDSTLFITIGSVNVNTPLPIELIYFSAELNNRNTVDLSWSTATEMNNHYFTIDRSIDAKEWEEMIQINGAGNSTSKKNYTTFDSNPYRGVSYYRLRQTDYDGKESYSSILPIKNNPTNSTIEVYPNPTNGLITVKGSNSEILEIKIFNSLGQDVTNKSEKVGGSGFDSVIDLKNLPEGHYFIWTSSGSKMFIKQK